MRAVTTPGIDHAQRGAQTRRSSSWSPGSARGALPSGEAGGPASQPEAERFAALPLASDERVPCKDGRVSDPASEDLTSSWFADVRLTGLAPRETWLSPKIEVRASPVHGRGTFAVAEIAAAETVEVWGQLWQGRLTAEYTGDAARAVLAARHGMVVMQWDDDLFSIECRGGDPGYFINHSCDPAMWFGDAFTLQARRLVLAGDELTLDYALFEADDSFQAAWICRCGTACCRGSVTGRDWMRTELQSRYAGRFTPLLDKRIAALPAGEARPDGASRSS